MGDVDVYTRAGTVLLVFGLLFGAYSYWVLEDVSLTSLGLSSVILGATALLIPSSPVPRDSVRALVEAGAVNVEAVLEEFDAKARGYYLPPRNGRVHCYVPLGTGFEDHHLKRRDAAPLRVLTEVSGFPGVVVFPPGSEAVRLAGLGEGAGVEDALSYVLVDFMEAVEAVKAVVTGDRVVVELNHVRADTSLSRYHACLGSLPVSTAGCVLAWVTGAPVAYTGERSDGTKVTAGFRVVKVG